MRGDVAFLLLAALAMLTSGHATPRPRPHPKGVLELIQEDVRAMRHAVEDIRNREPQVDGTCLGSITGTDVPLLNIAVSNSQLGNSYLVVLENKTWTEARQACLDLGYYMAWIDSPEENVYIQGILTSYDVAQTQPYVWMDGSDEGHEGCWVWTAPQVVLWSHVTWCRGQPNNYRGIQNCASIGIRDGGCWHDIDCDTYKTYFVCKRGIDQRVTSVVPRSVYNSTSLC